jgi:hypothetical protein
MNELKPEDVLKAWDILDKMDFFQGQRAGRELWLEKPFEVQEQDIADFSQGVAFLKNLIADALALLREKDAHIKELEEAVGAEFTCFVGEPHKVDHCPYVDELVKKDAEIERLKAYIDRCKSGEEYWVKCLLERPHEARSDAITEFAEKLKNFYHNLSGKTVGGSVEYHIDMIAKEMKGENSNGNQN